MCVLFLGRRSVELDEKVPYDADDALDGVSASIMFHSTSQSVAMEAILYAWSLLLVTMPSIVVLVRISHFRWAKTRSTAAYKL